METGGKETYVVLQGLVDNRLGSVAVAKLAKRELTLFSRDLESLLYDQQEFMAIVQALATRSRMSRIRVATIDAGPAVRAGHRLVNLAQRFSSYIEVRRASRDHENVTETFLVADDTALLYRPLATRYEGYYDLHAPLEARQKLRLFDDIWEQAEPDPEFRRLGI
ncbi:MAG: acyltransferase [Gammaproteobacteria bacterium]